MATKLAPTRGNLVKLTRSMKMAQSGHDLLDQKRQVLMMELVRETGLSALIATHNLELAARMDRVVRLEHGVLVQG